MFASHPETSCPSARASAATPPMKVPQMPKIYNFTIRPPAGRRAPVRAHIPQSPTPQRQSDRQERRVEAVAQDMCIDDELPQHDRKQNQAEPGLLRLGLA